ncbi:MAG: HlyD family efflux transporter periplasmic adaptor subunit [Gemmataceae bacterium]|nr:HlyD family efflux transporter periplasmic adaptor subunit [Gemmataceae bacterium]
MKRTRNKFVLLLWTVGLAALVASTAGAIFAVNSSHGAGKGDPPGVAHAGGGVVCYGTMDVEGGVIPLVPLQPGRVKDVPFSENKRVEKGQVVLRMDPTLAKARLDEASADLAAAEAQLVLARKLPRQNELKADQQNAAIEIAKQRVKAAELARDRKQELLKKEQINAKEVEISARLVDEAKAALKAEEAKLEELELMLPKGAKEQVARAQADVDAKKAKVAQAQYGFDECEVKAPVDGYLVQVNVTPGSVIGGQSMQPPLQFAPDLPFIIRAEVEQEFANRVQPGQSVTVQEEHGGKESWSGKVKRLARWYTPRRGETIRLSNNEVTLLECIIELDSKTPALRLGQRMRVTVNKAQ